MGSRAKILSVIAMRFFFRRVQRKFECRVIEYRWFCIWHGQDGRESTRQRGLGRGIPIFFVSLAGFAHVDVGVNQSRKTYHVSGVKYQVRREAGKKREPLSAALEKGKEKVNLAGAGCRSGKKRFLISA